MATHPIPIRHLLPAALLGLLVTAPLLPAQGEGCTVGVVAGRATPDGRPLLWKNRDIRRRNNKVVHFREGGRACLGLLTAGQEEKDGVWAGINGAGFAIMNAASNDLPGAGGDLEGLFMRRALGACASVPAFEQLLAATAKKGRGVKASFGVIDALGGAAIFEVSRFKHRKYDANDPEEAPQGFIIRANFALTGVGKGSGFGRYERARRLFADAARRGRLTPRFILEGVARDLFTFGRNPYPLAAGAGPVGTARTVCRRSTVSVSLFHGVRQGGNLDRACYWVTLGNPLTAPPVPLFVAAGEVPAPLTGPPGVGSAAWDGAERLWGRLTLAGEPYGRVVPTRLLRITPPILTAGRANLAAAARLLDRGAPVSRERLRGLQNRCVARAVKAVERATELLTPPDPRRPGAKPTDPKTKGRGHAQTRK